MADKLIINGLAAPCRIGVTEEERTNPQAVWLDLELEIDAAKAAMRDDVSAAADYAELVEDVTRFIESRPFHLLETIAEEVASRILKRFDTPEVVVRVTKRALPGIESATVEVVRGK